MARLRDPIVECIADFEEALAGVGYEMFTPTADLDSDNDRWNIVVQRKRRGDERD